MDFAIYSVETGAILRKGQSTNWNAPLLGLQEGEAVFRGSINPATHYLPGGVPTLVQVQPTIIDPVDVKRHAARLLERTDWYVVRASEPGGQPVPQAVLDYRAAVRAASNAIEGISPIPEDYRDAKYWPDHL